MARKTGEQTFVHPDTGQSVVIQSIEDGSFRLVLPPRDNHRHRWALANNFTGGDTGTRMQIVEVR